jgi:hypothetical protein
MTQPLNVALGTVDYFRQDIDVVYHHGWIRIGVEGFLSYKKKRDGTNKKI